MSPDEFWDATLDEALLKYKGKVYDWNIHRGLTTVIVNTIGGLFKMPPIRPEQLISLPFDEVDPLTPEEVGEALMTDAQLWEEWEKQNKN